MNDLTKAKACEALWKMGLVSWKFHDMQISVYEAIKNMTGSMFVVLCGRQSGKSFLLCGYAIEYAMLHPGAKICYLAPTAKAVKKIIIPRIKEILSDCPRDLLPEYKVNDQVYKFKNGSEIHIAGTDAERAENLRGQVFHLVICDEAGFMDKLDYVVQSILRPLTITVNGKIILSSTPPISPAHPFKGFYDNAKALGNSIKKTIDDNPMISDKVKEEYMQESGGKDSVAWRREYLVEFIIDEKQAVIPEATEKKLIEITKQIVPYNQGMQVADNQIMKPMFFDGYVVADLGYTDNTGILFGYWDFYKACLVIEDEALFNKPNTKMIADIVSQKENALWAGKKPYMRFCDGDPIIISDLNTTHRLTFSQTRNDDLEASVNAVRLFIADNKIIIDPRCKNLILQLQSAIWKATNSDGQAKKFAKSADQGHYDLIAALMYMVRNIRRQKNPFPPGLGLDLSSMYLPKDIEKTKDTTNLEKMVTGPMNKFFPNSNNNPGKKNTY